MNCCLCMFTVRGKVKKATMIINGQSVCDDHAEFVQGGDFTQALIQVRKDSK